MGQQLGLVGRGDDRVPRRRPARRGRDPGQPVTLDSPNHILLSDEPAWPRSLAEFEAFLADRRP